LRRQHYIERGQLLDESGILPQPKSSANRFDASRGGFTKRDRVFIVGLAISASSRSRIRHTDSKGLGLRSGGERSHGSGEMIGQVVYWMNGMVTVCDEHGRPLPDYQGRIDEVKEMILRDATDSTTFMLGSWATQYLQDISRCDFAMFQSSRKPVRRS
jgi:hypothetical protein